MSIGTLYVIATPIGNMEDVTFRAIRILKEQVGIVFCEDTRQTRKLLNHYGITAVTQSLYTHSSAQKIEDAIGLLRSGKSIAYVTDSGTPGISDPGSRLVDAALSRKIPVCPIPGPSALAAIVSVAGYHGKNIVFAGFLSKKENRRKNELLKLKESDGIIILYESPYRIKKLIHAISEIFPDSRVLIGREMTKLHEEFICGSITNLVTNIDALKEKGEFTVAIINNHQDKFEYSSNYE
jgi:16S rRNA (cytidine1402-2'-O)-methyltransferase